MASRISSAVFALLFAAGPLGCQWHPQAVLPAPPTVVLLDNPLFVAAADREFLWNQIVDTLDDYFQIQREERVRLVGDVLIEGRIETLPTAGSTLLEPWRKDSTPGFEKLHASLQSIRRRAILRVIPADGGYLVDVAVYKELEDVGHPLRVVSARATSDLNSSADRGDKTAAGRRSPAGAPSNWIAQGRDTSLEQRILGQIQARLAAR
jgi:hypothetical protein